MTTDQAAPHEPVDPSGLPRAAFAFPGPLRDRLVAAILAGTKTTTTSLLVEYERAREPLPAIGDRSVVIDSADRPVAVIETTDVQVVPLEDVDEDHAADEGEGHTTVEAWRADHEDFWHSEQAREAFGDPDFTVSDSTPVVLERFHVAADLRSSDPTG
ncbi:ASCH domain-containing protein [Actinopolymorpha sp. NPDC004070]|uniref:ASCH domain-containing protein n=1 Tax=Actinopolymorpha sp. NPDC004070 TaxID=3154548 RepID=UPI0033A1B11B